MNGPDGIPQCEATKVIVRVIFLLFVATSSLSFFSLLSLSLFLSLSFSLKEPDGTENLLFMFHLAKLVHT